MQFWSLILFSLFFFQIKNHTHSFGVALCLQKSHWESCKYLQCVYVSTHEAN